MRRVQLHAGIVFQVACVLATLSSAARRLDAQTCTCVTTQPFGACTETKATYPDAFPGAALIVPRVGETTLLYVVDLFSGFTYLFDDATRLATLKPEKLNSPQGSSATTGLAFKQAANGVTTLFWAIEDRIFSSDSRGSDVTDLGAVELGRLAQMVRDLTGDNRIVTGRLGGITYHKSRAKLWGVDIENDIYFEMEENGQLVLNDGKPVFFFSPRRNQIAGGAFGTSIAYVESGGKEYFDIPVGSVADRRTSEVHRVHAIDTESTRIGDATGSFYPLGSALGSPRWVTGITFWPSSCSASQSSTILLDLDTIEGGEPKIIQVAADEPTAANVAGFTTSTDAATEVKMIWRKTLPYQSLKITRRSISKPTTPVVTVFENAAFDSDPQTFTDRGVIDGSYEYTVAVTAAVAVPTVSSRITLGVGSIAASQAFVGAGSSVDPTPYALALVNNEKVIVADLNTGNAEVFNVDLVREGTLDGPVNRGLTVGLAWNSATNQLHWLQSDSGQHFLHTTDLNGASLGPAVPVDTPLSISDRTELAEIVFDAVGNYLWTIDLKSKSAFGFTTAGTIAAEFKSSLVQNPEPAGILGGGIAVVAATDKIVTLDFTLGKDAKGLVDQIGRFEYTRGTFGTKKEISRIDLQGTTGASDFGGIEIFSQDGAPRFEFVVGVDTRTIYKINLDSPTKNLVVFRRGDINNDAALNISDPSYLLSHLFKGGAEPPCVQAGDADNNGKLEISDAVSLFAYLFKGGAAPPAPFAACGVSFGATLACAAATCVD